MADSYQQIPTCGWKLGGHQPARALLLDVIHAVELNVWGRVIAALENFFAIASSIARPASNLVFTIYLLDSYPQLLLPLSPLKGNLCRLQAALDAVKTHVQQGLPSSPLSSQGCLLRGLAEACSQFRRYVNAAGHVQLRENLRCHQLEVIIISGANPEILAKELDNGKCILDTHNIRRVAIAVLTQMTDDMAGPQTFSTCTSAFDLIHLQTDDTSLQKFVYTWLLDRYSDSEHLQLHLPPASPADKELIIKCDLAQRILNPAQLPYYECFTIQPEVNAYEARSGNSDTSLDFMVPALTLQASALLPVDKVCDSLTFGLPLLVNATMCWRLAWEELKTNAANLRGLCQELVSKKQAVLLQLKHQSGVVESSLPLFPRGLFILLPALNNTLLLKAIANKELLLPSTVSDTFLDAATHDTSVLRVQSSLTQVPLVEEFNPLNYSSGLAAVLLHQAASKQFVRNRSSEKCKTAAKTKRSHAGLHTPLSALSIRQSPTAGACLFTNGPRTGDNRCPEGIRPSHTPISRVQRHHSKGEHQTNSCLNWNREDSLVRPRHSGQKF
ncbi:meiosis 1 arrest protein-like [Pomacea canaliculata]|uniref:meiosis 1 arrest protein-like n=1 Tax=Pomacea canaliculata TaxID=400727 RepID=UPI000D73F076|nr:meiosis 1 arrest protein-like [Pomacea canaliculata]XP_025088794.1 meiosis 1 arrest protein-like [Pomacea canaliculata]